MKIAFVDCGACVYTGAILEKKGIGGSETALIRMAEEFVKLGYEVDAYTKKNGKHNGVSYYKKIQDKNYDIVIHSRGFNEEIRGKFGYMWVHDYLADYAVKSKALWDEGKIIKYIVCSQWQKQEMISKMGMQEKMFFVVPHGVKKEYFNNKIKRQKNKVIYSSSPYRGLEYLLSIWDDVVTEVPDAELHLYGGHDVYQSKMPKQELYAEAEKKAGIFVHGNVTQKELAEAFCSSDVWAYPTDFPEIFCITGIESMSGGCVTVSTLGSAVVENGGGLFVTRDKYKQTLIQTLKDEELKSKIRKKNLTYNFDWSEPAKYMSFAFKKGEKQKSILVAQITREEPKTPLSNLNRARVPQGYRLDSLCVFGKPVDIGREICMDTALGENDRNVKYDYLFFLDDDVYMPDNTILKLIKDVEDTGASCVCAWYPKKHQPIEFAGMGKNETIINEPEDKLYEADLCPMGAALIDMRKVEKLGKPYFKMQGAGSGEDTFFTLKLINNGHKCYIDGGLLCMHKDIKTGKEFHYGEYEKEGYTIDAE